MRWAERWFWFWSGALASGLFHLFAIGPDQIASNARAWMALVGR